MSAELGPSAIPRSMRGDDEHGEGRRDDEGEHGRGPDEGEDEEDGARRHPAVERPGEEPADREGEEEEAADESDLRRADAEFVLEGLGDDAEGGFVAVVDDVEDDEQGGERPRLPAGLGSRMCRRGRGVGWRTMSFLASWSHPTSSVAAITLTLLIARSNSQWILWEVRPESGD